MAKQNNYSVMGLDLSLAATGLSIEGGHFSAHHTLPTKSRKLGGDARLVGLKEEMEALIVYARMLGFPVKLAVLEDLPTHAKSAGLTGRAQGVARVSLQGLGVPYLAIAPATLKKAASGKGNADKYYMRQALLNGMGEHLADDNQVDAYWLLQCGRELLGEPNQLVDPSALDKHREEVEKLCL